MAHLRISGQRKISPKFFPFLANSQWKFLQCLGLPAATGCSARLTIRQTRYVPWGHEKIQATCVRKTFKFELWKLKRFFWSTYCCEINLQYLLFRGVHDCFLLQ